MTAIHASTERRPWSWPTLATAALCALWHVVAAYFGISLFFEYERGTYFAILPERLMMVLALQVGVVVALVLAALPGTSKARLLRAAAGLASVVTSQLLYFGMERIAFRVLEFSE